MATTIKIVDTTYFFISSDFDSSGKRNPLNPTIATPNRTIAQPYISFFEYYLLSINFDRIADVAITPHVNIEFTEGGKKFKEI